eukprot:CAMPEP_0206139250 /NCGR_PEP_ID=MMETSP1473-20131121/5152_1 /ASSEMBLY_ACC=CAM_ASM_001109 /TAXON_ID=1461547 /ORGANISM="Stichococcus sp, Strain RCC1054" /LENGTH=76 /DNA_ID=CAMNT_0053532949 /DNA_START=107 /DNA_END=334 /DNA_ORIENTATION=-
MQQQEAASCPLTVHASEMRSGLATIMIPIETSKHRGNWQAPQQLACKRGSKKDRQAECVSRTVEHRQAEDPVSDRA